MKIENHFVVDATCEKVWQAINDPTLIARCIPGCESVEVTEQGKFRATISVRLGTVNARFNLVVEITEESPPCHQRSIMQGEEGTRASTLRAVNVLSLEAVNAYRTSVSFNSEVTITGRLGRFGLGVMRKKADALGREFTESFQEQVEMLTA